MSADCLQFPESSRDQVEALFRMYNGPRPLFYGAQRLTIFEVPSASSVTNPLAEALARKQAQLRCLQFHLVRVLWVAFVGLLFCLIRSMTHHHFDWILAVPLWVLTTSCVPLLLMATQDLKEIR